MTLAQAMVRLLPGATLQSASEIDAEIRDELEFHLAMRTEENVRDGLPPEEARHDAEQRFGDYESSRRACRKIDLGPQLLVQRVQLTLLVLLAAAVVFQAVVLVNQRASSATQIEALTRTIEQMRNAGQEQSADVPTMPYLQLTSRSDVEKARESKQIESTLQDWHRGDVLAKPWSDWRTLQDDAKGMRNQTEN